jgi:hypothetical protein
MCQAKCGRTLYRFERPVESERRPAPLPRLWSIGVVQDPNQILSVETGTLLRLIQQPATTSFVGTFVLFADYFQILFARVHVHLSSVSCSRPLGYIFI